MSETWTCRFDQNPGDGPTSAATNKSGCTPRFVPQTGLAPGTAALRADGSSCVYTSTSHASGSCPFDWSKSGQLEVDISLSAQCAPDEWTSFWLDPRPYDRSREVDFMESATGFQGGHVFTNFGGGGNGSIWIDTQGAPLLAPFKRHVTAWAVPSESDHLDVFVKNCDCPQGVCPSTCTPSIDRLSHGDAQSALGAVAWTTVPRATPGQNALLVADNWGRGGPGTSGKPSPGCTLKVDNLKMYQCGRPGQPTCQDGACISPVGGQVNGQPVSLSVQAERQPDGSSLCVAQVS